MTLKKSPTCSVAWLMLACLPPNSRASQRCTLRPLAPARPPCVVASLPAAGLLGSPPLSSSSAPAPLGQGQRAPWPPCVRAAGLSAVAACVPPRAKPPEDAATKEEEAAAAARMSSEEESGREGRDAAADGTSYPIGFVSRLDLGLCCDVLSL